MNVEVLFSCSLLTIPTWLLPIPAPCPLVAAATVGSLITTATPSVKKKCNYGIIVGQINSSLTKIIVNNISIYVSK
jgi:hypothetical protein